MSDTAPILLRPSSALARAMTEAAAVRGLSRQTWMLLALQGACAEYMRDEPHPDDVPLFEAPDPRCTCDPIAAEGGGHWHQQGCGAL